MENAPESAYDGRWLWLRRIEPTYCPLTRFVPRAKKISHIEKSEKTASINRALHFREQS